MAKGLELMKRYWIVGERAKQARHYRGVQTREIIYAHKYMYIYMDLREA